MSLSTMVRLGVEADKARRDAAPRTEEEAPVPGAPAPPVPAAPAAPATVGGAPITAASDPKGGFQAALDAIAAYIPSEALAVYIALLGAFQPGSDAGRWLSFGLGVLLVLAFGGLNALDRQTRPTTRTFLIVMVLALLSFITYAGALPASPFLALSSKATLAFGIVALVLSYALPKVARIVGVAASAG